MIAAAILAGGGARRLGGRQKVLLTVGGRTILDRQLAALSGLCAPIAVVGRGPEPAYAARGVDVLCDPEPWRGQGPMAGIIAALAWSPAPYALILAGDMPAIARDAVALLAHILEGVIAEGHRPDAVVPVIAGAFEPLFAIYSTAAAAALTASLAAGQRSVRAFLGTGALTIRTVDEGALRAVDPTLATFTNINSPDDFRCADRIE